jgi:hypothetical protein
LAHRIDPEDDLSAEETNMFRQTHFALAAVVFLTASTIAARGFAQKQSPPRPVDKQVLGEDEVKQLLLLMDTDRGT